MRMKHLLAAAVGSVFVTTFAHSHEATLKDLTVIHPMAFETAKTARAGAGYMAIYNDGAENDRLLEIRADFPRVMLHTTEEADGVARMVHLDSIEVPAGDTTLLEPGGLHVMFMGLDGDPFEEGEEIPATLVFEKAGELDVVFKVEKRDGAGHDHSGHGNHSNHGEHSSEEDHSDHNHN